MQLKSKLIIKKIITILAILFAMASVAGFLYVVKYLKYTYDANKSIPICYEYGNDHYYNDEVIEYGDFGCYEKMYHLMLPKLLVYKAYKDNKPIDGIYKVCNVFSMLENAILSSDAILSWGIGNDVVFEEFMTKRYDIPLYLFDCGADQSTINKLKKEFNKQNVHIQNECLGTDKYLMFNQKSSHKVHSFGQKLNELNLQNKKVYVKLGIPELQEYVEDIIKHKDNITAISTSIDVWSPKHIVDYIKFFNTLENDFILISRNVVEKSKDANFPEIKYIKPKYVAHVSLLYVNKKYVDGYYLPWEQNSRKTGHAISLTNERGFAPLTIDPTVVLFEKIKILKNKFKK